MPPQDYELHYPWSVRFISFFQRRDNDGLTRAERQFHGAEYARKVGYSFGKRDYQISAKMVV